MKFATILFLFGFLVAISHAAYYRKRAAPMKRHLPFLQKFRLGNLFRVEADARAKIFNNEIGIDGAVGVGGDGIGAHASADADLLGQKAKIHADVLDGHAIDQHGHETLRDSANRQYILQRQYIGSKSVLVRKYLDNGQMYVVGSNDDNVVQHGHADEGRIYNKDGGWLDRLTGKYYNRFGQLVHSYSSGHGYQLDRSTESVNTPHREQIHGEWQKDGSYIADDPVHTEQVSGGWQKDGSYIAVDPVHTQQVSGGWQKDGSYIAVDPVHTQQVSGGWQKDGSYIAVDPVHTEQVSGGWQKDGSYIAVDPVHAEEVSGGWQKDGSYIAVDPIHTERVSGGWQKDGSYIAVDPLHTEQLKIKVSRDGNGRIVQKTVTDDHHHQQEQYKQQELQK